MEKASRVMYSIANFFTWIVVLICIAGIVLFSLALTNVIPNTTGYGSAELIGSIIWLSVILVVALISIWMVRMAKKKGTSKGWDILFIVIGVLSSNIFYILGGIFGLVARK